MHYETKNLVPDKKIDRAEPQQVQTLVLPKNFEISAEMQSAIHAVSDFIHCNFKPDLIFIACGADAHLEDPLSSLEYSVAGYRQVAKLIRKHYSDIPILMGGAGGYLPDTRTPEVWAGFAAELAN